MFRSLRRAVDRLRGDLYDTPASGGGFHLWWRGLPADEPIVACEITLEILHEPQVPRIYFWAMQMTFLDEVGTNHGVAHTGLQWNPRHADHRAVNWGGYRQAADVTSILEGSDSPLPSTPDDRNTRDFPWRVGVPYRLAVRRGAQGWEASITDTDLGETIPIRELYAGGDRLGHFVVWTELFCAGRDPRSVVRWSDPAVITLSGETREPSEMVSNYPGGPEWRRLDACTDAVGIVQSTDTRRSTRHGAALKLRG